MKKVNKKKYCTLYLLRHGETEWNVKKINQGQSESSLTKVGIKQARKTAKKLKNVKFDAIFSSDLSRTRRTAEIIKLDRELDLQTSKLLRERSYGSFEGKHFDVLKSLLKDKLAERESLSEEKSWSFKLADDIETDEVLASRFINHLKEISVAYPNKIVLVVSHGGPIQIFLAKMGYKKKKGHTGSFLKNAEYIKALSDGVDFFIKK